MHAADALDEGRLAGTVVAEQGEDLTGADLEIDAVEGDHGAEGLGRTTNTQHELGVNGRLGLRGVHSLSHASLACMLRNRFSTRARTTSSSTATSTTTPTAMYWKFGSRPSRLRPLCMTPRINAPATALRTPPRPPRKLPPPMITAAMALSSKPCPVNGEPASAVPTKSMPPIAPDSPLMT